MAYKPGRKESGVVVSDAAGRVLGPEDPGVRAEMEAQRDREFGVVEQIGLAADMLPGGAIAAGGAKAAAAGGRNIFKMINDSITGFKTGGAKAAKDAVLKWASSTDLTILTDAMNYLDGLSGKALAEIEPVRKAINEVYNQFSAPKGGFSLGAKPASSTDTSTALGYVQDLQAKASKVLDISDPMNLPSEDILSRAGNFMGKGTYAGAEVISKLVDSVSVESISKALSEVTEVLSNSKYWKVLNKTDVGRKRLNFLGNIKNMLSGAMQNIERAGKKGVKISDKTTDVMATKDLPAATRMSKDMPPLSGKSRVSQEGLEYLAWNVDDISSMTDDQVMYWIELERKMKPLDASTARYQKEKIGLLLNEAKKRGLL